MHRVTGAGLKKDHYTEDNKHMGFKLYFLMNLISRLREQKLTHRQKRIKGLKVNPKHLTPMFMLESKTTLTWQAFSIQKRNPSLLNIGCFN